MESEYSIRLKNIGRNIAHYRNNLGVSQQELADRVGISKSYLSKIEAPNTEKAFSLQVLFDIADALDISIASLFDDL